MNDENQPSPDEPAGPIGGKGDTSCGFVALIGAPNSGKSTLTNALVGAKISIVTHKAQTTRGPVRGLALEDNTQIVLVDTPGIFQPRRRLDRAMTATAWDRAADADLILLVVDARRGADEKAMAVVERLDEMKVPAALAINKVDLVKKPKLLELVADLSAPDRFDETFMISALNGDGVAD
ncbi:GTPase Era [Methyloligella halotolerans]|uniref:GTPase Era n=1 Tax=Methyloligella halotolerans TaxID=1177755 RepID=A0A1E2S2F5_9HYPH|nr:GTPase Era [Methyloligella halotolerans]